jgi:hypothetical protein
MYVEFGWVPIMCFLHVERNRNKARVKIGQAKTNEGNRYVGVYSFSRGISEMKRIALAVLLALCGARVYGQAAVPAGQAEVAITQEDVKRLQAALNDTKSIEALADQLGLPKEEVKGWFSRHKTAVISSIVGLATLYGTGCGLGKIGAMAQTKEDPNKFVDGTWRIRQLCAKLACWYTPLVWMENKAVAGKNWSKENKWEAAGLILAAILVGALIYDLAHGKDAKTVILLKKAFGKKAVADVQAVVEDAKKEEAKVNAAVAPAPAVVPATA